MWLSKKAEHEYEIEYEYDVMAGDHMNGVYVHTLKSGRANARAHMIEHSSAQLNLMLSTSEWKVLNLFFLFFFLSSLCRLNYQHNELKQ